MIPAKLNNGDPFKYNVARTINNIIDCLKEQQITSVVGGTFARTKGGTTITIPHRAGGGASSGSSAGSGYRGSFAIVRNADGTYSVGNNELGYIRPNSVMLNLEEVTVPVTNVTVGKVYLRIDRRSLVGTLENSCSIVQEEYSDSDDAVWEFYIGKINEDGTIEQAYTGGGGTTPLMLADNVKDFFELRNGNFSLNSNIDLNAYYVPVVMNGVLGVRIAEPLPNSAYEE
jgi:hypothetical protein